MKKTSSLWGLVLLSLSCQVAGQLTRHITSMPFTRGPVSGGTNIRIYGGNFTDLHRIEYVATTPPENITFAIQFANDTRIHALTPNVSEDLINVTGAIRLYFGDDVILNTQQNFTYLADPVIESVTPLKTIMRGGIVQTVVGRNLDSVHLHFMTMTLVVQYERTYKQPYDIHHPTDMVCELQSSTLMYCKARPFSKFPHLESHHPETGINKDNYQIFIGFVLDGVKTFQNYSIITVFANPQFEDFPEAGGQHILPFKVYKGEEYIELKGQHLNYGVTRKDFTVRVGSDGTCEVTEVITNQLKCRPPQQRPAVGTINYRGEPNVQVEIGFLVETIGYLKYEVTWWDDEAVKTGFIVGICVAVLLVTVIPIVAVTIYKKRKRNQPGLLDPEHEYQRHVGLLDRIDPDVRRELEPCLKDAERLKLGKALGEGNFGCVHAGKFLDDDNKTQLVAAKTLKDTSVSRSEFREFLEEATIMKDFHHENVLHLVGVVLKQGRPYVLLPFMENGDLRGYISNANNCFTVENLLSYAHQAAKGMAYLEGLKKVHRDLAARNCMVSKDDVVKIADFGLARDIFQDDYYRVENMLRPLPVKWMAPECLDDRKFTTKSDVWSYGVLVWELLTRGKRPYAHVDNYEMKVFLQKGRRLEKPSVAPDEVYELMLECWQMNPSDRPSFVEIATRLGDFIEEQAQEVALGDGLTNAHAGTEDSYQNLSRYVDYNSDRHGYERISRPESYLAPVSEGDFGNIPDPAEGYLPPAVTGVPDGYVPPVLLQASKTQEGNDEGYLPPKALANSNGGIQNPGYLEHVPVNGRNGGPNAGQPQVYHNPTVSYQNMSELNGNAHYPVDHSAISIET